MDILEAKKEIVKIGRWCYEKDFIAGYDGNLSIRIDDRIVTTPNGMCKGHLATEDIVVADLNGNILEGFREPSSEIGMHLEVYSCREEINACVHAHPPVSTGFAVAGQPLTEDVLPEISLTLGGVPLAPYATPGTDEMPDSIRPLLQNYNAFLLANHGVLAIAQDINKAFYRLQKVEHFAKVMLTAHQLGNVNTLSEDDLRRLMEQK